VRDRLVRKTDSEGSGTSDGRTDLKWIGDEATTAADTNGAGRCSLVSTVLG